MSDRRGLHVYVGSSFSLKDRVIDLVEAIEDAGHHVPCQWWERDVKDYDGPDHIWYKQLDTIETAERNFGWIRWSQAFVLVAPEHQTKKFNGANVELGYAHAHNTPVYAYGQLERSGMYTPVTRYDSVLSIIRELDQIEETIRSW